jgi:hypothetical protein
MRWLLLLIAISSSSVFAHGVDHNHTGQGTAPGIKRAADTASSAKTGSSRQAQPQKTNEAGSHNPNWFCVQTPQGKTNCLAMPGHGH